MKMKKVKNPRKRAWFIACGIESKDMNYWNSAFINNVYPSRECAELAKAALESTGYFKGERLSVVKGPCLCCYKPNKKINKEKRK